MIRLILTLFLCSSLNGAVLFNGVNNFITMGPTNALNSTNFTLSAWIYITGAGPTASSGSSTTVGMPIICKHASEGDDGPTDGNYFFSINTNNFTLQGDYEDFRASGNNNPVTSAVVMAFSTWYHVGLVHSIEETKLQLYLNGLVVGTLITNTAPRADSIQHFGIGSAITSLGESNGFFMGIITDAAMWNTALTTNEMVLLAKSRVKGMPLQIRGANLKGYWPLDDRPDGTALTGSNTVINRTQAILSGSPVNSPLAKGETVLVRP